ncbi:MAG: glycosyltransferase involved in cell wall biosynthesis [Ascidiaceihabitans sp.]|jgi:glycosyltransferase involved in cell wall biosynthesis
MFDPAEAYASYTKNVGFVCFDITDLLHFLTHSHTVTGIQRVQMEATRAVLGQRDIKAMCCFFSESGDWQIIDSQLFCDVFDDFSRGAIGWKDRLEAFLLNSVNAPIYDFSTGDSLILLGATWNIRGLFESLRDLQFKGVDCVVYMHDLLPLSHPEYFEEQHAIEFGYWFTNILQVASGLICNSSETRQAILDLSDYSGKIDVVELNVAPGSVSPPPDRLTGLAKPAPSDVIARYGLEPKNYALMVGTLEPRKNHVTAFNVWMALDKALGDRCPKLVVVGKTGWKCDGILAHLESLNRHGRIVWVDDANDHDLEVLYKDCLCGLYLSRAEGWGLPVSEALAAGKPVVCGQRSSAVRARQNLAITVDECSERDVINTLYDLFSNRFKLVNKASIVSSSATFKTWDTFGDQILTQSKSMCGLAHKGKSRAVTLGESYTFGHGAEYANLDINCFADSLLWGNFWHKAENWGVWSSDAQAVLRFTLPDVLHSYDAYIRVVSPHAETEISVLRDGQEIARKPVQGPTLLKATLPPKPGAEFVSLTLQTDNTTDMSKDDSIGDNRMLGLGLAEIRFVRSDDLHARLNALEHFL